MLQAKPLILYVDDDAADGLLLRRAFSKAGVGIPFVVISNGKDAIDYLSGRGPYADRNQHPLPCLVLLDLKMPGVSGLEVVRWIRTTPSIAMLPIIMLSSSNRDLDVHNSYLAGANGYLVKPSQLDAIMTMARAIWDYWLVHNRADSPVRNLPLEASRV